MISTFSAASKTTRIGLDVGDYSVRAVQLARSSDGHAVARAARHCRRRPGTSAPDESHSAADAIRACLQLAEFRGKRVQVALDTPDIELHALEIPEPIIAAGAAELARTVQWEVERLTTAGHNGIETRHWSLPATPASAPNAIGVAAPCDTVLQVVDACGNAGLACAKVDAAATVLCRFGCLVNRWDSQVVWGILDLGCRQTRLVLCVDEVPVLVREAGPGGSEWTERIADSLQISTKAAEVKKKDVGIALTGRGARAGSDVVPASELSSILTGILRGNLHDIASEVKRSYEYVLSCYPARCAADLVLVGGGAATKNLPEYLTNALGIPVHRASFYLDGDSCRLRYTVGKQDRLGDFALAIGLAVTW